MLRLLLSYAQDLNDAYPGHEFSIWSEEQLLGFFNEALCLIAAHRPDMFTELKVVRVEPCSNYLDLCDCEKVLDVLGQSNAKGNNIRPIQRRKSVLRYGQAVRKNKTLLTALPSTNYLISLIWCECSHRTLTRQRTSMW